MYLSTRRLAKAYDTIALITEILIVAQKLIQL